MPALIAIRGLRKAYVMGDETVHALAGVDLDFQKGEFVAILGPSGSGKSTLMHILGFMDTPTEGSIVFDGQEVAKLDPDLRAWYRSNRVGFVFQSFNLLPRLTVLENVALPLLYRENSDPVANAAAAKVALERVGMSHRLDHRPSQLSGGERQRVAIARALYRGAELIILDEATSSLDVIVEHEISETLENLRNKVTLIIVSHRLSLVRETDEIFVFEDGAITERGPHEELMRTSNLYKQMVMRTQSADAA